MDLDELLNEMKAQQGKPKRKPRHISEAVLPELDGALKRVEQLARDLDLPRSFDAQITMQTTIQIRQVVTLALVGDQLQDIAKSLRAIERHLSKEQS